MPACSLLRAFFSDRLSYIPILLIFFTLIKKEQTDSDLRLQIFIYSFFHGDPFTSLSLGFKINNTKQKQFESLFYFHTHFFFENGKHVINLVK